MNALPAEALLEVLRHGEDLRGHVDRHEPPAQHHQVEDGLQERSETGIKMLYMYFMSMYSEENLAQLASSSFFCNELHRWRKAEAREEDWTG